VVGKAVPRRLKFFPVEGFSESGPFGQGGDPRLEAKLSGLSAMKRRKSFKSKAKSAGKGVMTAGLVGLSVIQPELIPITGTLLAAIHAPKKKEK
jgi:hypothetical protein